MNCSQHYLPIDVRNYIIGQLQSYVSYSVFIQRVETRYNRTITKGAISKLKDKFEEINSVNDLPKVGRPQFFTDNQKEN